jgi:hypothetical protein
MVAGLALALFSGEADAEGAKLISLTLERASETSKLDDTAVEKLRALRSSQTLKSVSAVLLDPNAILSNIISVDLPFGKPAEFIKAGEERVDSKFFDKGVQSKYPTSYHWFGKSVDGYILNINTTGEEVFASVSNKRQLIQIRRLNEKYYSMLEYALPLPFIQDVPASSASPETK